MAALTSKSFPLKPPLVHRTTSLSFLDSKLFGIRLSNSNHVNLNSGRLAVTSRFGGYRPRPRPKPSPSDRYREVEVEQDSSLDISSIRSTSVRLIDAEQKVVGVVPKSEAVQMASDAELDLVILSAEADPPVVKIMDYNKYLYEQRKKKRDQQKKSSAGRVDIKELKMGYNIDIHDYTVRLKAAKKFLKGGDKVKIMVNMKGRQNQFRNNAIELIKRFQNDVGELAQEESKSYKDRSIFVVLVPNKAVIQKLQEEPKKERPAETESKVSAAETETETETTEVSANA